MNHNTYTCGKCGNAHDRADSAYACTSCGASRCEECDCLGTHTLGCQRGEYRYIKNETLRLSKRDFEKLGCEDVPGPMLRAKVFKLEGLVAELALTLEEVVADQDRQEFVGPEAWYRAREILSTVREKYNYILSMREIDKFPNSPLK